MKKNDESYQEYLARQEFLYGMAIAVAIAMISTIITVCMFKLFSWIPKTISESNSESMTFGIVKKKNGMQPEIIYDKETQIMYIMTDSGYITPLLDSNGKVRKYEEEK